MIGGKEDEKFLLFFKVCVIIASYMLIGLCLLVYFGVKEVKAASSIQFYNSGGENLLECYNCNQLQSMNNYSYITFNYSFDYQPSTNVNLQFNNFITIDYYDGNSISISVPEIILASGYNTYNISSYCTEVVATQQTTDTSYSRRKIYHYAYTCDIPNYGGNFPNYKTLKITYNKTGGTYLNIYGLDNGFTISETPYQQDISSDLNAVGGNIINNQNQNTESIINNNNSNTQSIIDNQNQNTQQVTDAIKEQNKKCENYNYTNEPIGINNSYLNNNGQVINEQSAKISIYIPILENKTYNLTRNWNTNTSLSYCLYGEDKSLISCTNYGTNTNINITPQVNGFIRYSISFLSNRTITFTGQYCYNLIEKQNQTQQEQYDYLTDNTPANANIISGIALPNDAPITTLLTIPLTLVQAFLTGLNSSCVSVNFGSLYGTNLGLSCGAIRDIPRFLGSAYDIIDYLMVFFMIYNIFQLFVTAYNTITTLKDDFHNIYETKTYETRGDF